MKLIGNYSEDIKDLIQGVESYSIPADKPLTLDVLGNTIFNPIYTIKLSVFQNGSFQEEYVLELNKDFYVKNGEIYLRPNELLDSEGYFEGNYTLRFDFIKIYT